LAKTPQNDHFVTHNVREAACLADRVVIMSPTRDVFGEIFGVDLPRRAILTVSKSPSMRRN